ncbi:MAG: 2-amino-4-hydroxy-6-hydroxymethyldihydropteridine diphosphokinase, partial [Chloroflexota bacterium]|nr:2-amino-4-hydroxy-6-hydroxymethyldihydropteridine diphosphokinase [Chloroflexota bacterium]
MEAAKPVEGDGVIAYLGLGSNMGDSLAHLENGLVVVGMLPGTRVVNRSPLYVTKAWGKTNQPDFLNMVAEISTELPPETLLSECKKIEQQEGRTEGEHWGPRPLDIDILL